MQKSQRIFCALAVLLLFFCLWSPVSAVEGAGIGLTMTASRSRLKVEETVDVSILTDGEFTTRGSGITLYYDEEKLEPVLEESSAASPFRLDGPLNVNGKTALRISFLPGPDATTFSPAEPLAVLRFRALGVTENAVISMGAACLYDELLSEIPLTRPEALTLTLEPAEVYVPVTGLRLDTTELTLEEGEMAAIKALIEPTGASDPYVSWTSSDETVAKVTGGAVKALSEGRATITATTRDGNFTASCAVTVTPPDAGYTVRMPGDTAAVMGGTIEIPVTVSNQDGKTGYNAFDISLTYDPNALELVSTQLPGLTLTASGSTIQVLDYGEDRSAGSVAFTLKFRALKLGDTEVQITSARVDNSGNAVTKNTSRADLADDRTAITVTGYPVTLPEGFSGNATATPNTAYTFTAPEDYYDYTVTVSIGGKTISVTKNDDGSYTIPAEQVTGEITVTAEKTGKAFSVTLGTDMTGDATARYGTDYAATITRDDAYRYTVTVSIGGKEYTGFTASGNTYTIPGTDITGAIVFKVTKEKITTSTGSVTRHSVTFTGSGAGAAQGNASSVAQGSSYTFSLKKQTGYSYTVSYKMGGKSGGTLSPNSNGSYTIPNVTGALVITIEKTLNIQVSVQEFLTLDEKSVFLILAESDPGTGNVFTYDGSVMYYSEVYEAWAYLVIAEDELELSQAKSLVKISSQDKRLLEDSGCDVDGNGLTDWNDMRLIQSLYHANYDAFTTISMAKFLNADINGDKKVDTLDAVHTAWIILKNEEAGT